MNCGASPWRLSALLPGGLAAAPGQALAADTTAIAACKLEVGSVTAARGRHGPG